MNKPTVSYASNELSAAQKLHYKHAIVQSQDGMVYLFSSEAATVAIMNPRKLFKNFDDFTTRATEQDLVELHKVLFDKDPTAKELKDLVELSVKVWIRLCETAINRLETKSPDGTKSPKLQNRQYEVLSTEVPANIKLPPQAKTCLAFFAEQIKPKVDSMVAAGTKIEDVGVISVSEAEHAAYVKEHAARLNTRQDPWRIFQYYRPQLIENKMIRMV